MDAVKCLKESWRMCKSFKDCNDCLINDYCQNSEVLSNHAEEIVSIVDQWSKEHPSKTRAEVFIEMFPNSKPYQIRPCDIEKHLLSENGTCNGCRYWGGDHEDYWTSPAPEGFGKGDAK